MEFLAGLRHAIEVPDLAPCPHVKGAHLAGRALLWRFLNTRAGDDQILVDHRRRGDAQGRLWKTLHDRIAMQIQHAILAKAFDRRAILRMKRDQKSGRGYRTRSRGSLPGQ